MEKNNNKFLSLDSSGQLMIPQALNIAFSAVWGVFLLSLCDPDVLRQSFKSLVCPANSNFFSKQDQFPPVPAIQISGHVSCSFAWSYSDARAYRFSERWLQLFL